LGPADPSLSDVPGRGKRRNAKTVRGKVAKPAVGAGDSDPASGLLVGSQTASKAAKPHGGGASGRKVAARGANGGGLDAKVASYLDNLYGGHAQVLQVKMLNNGLVILCGLSASTVYSILNCRNCTPH